MLGLYFYILLALAILLGVVLTAVLLTGAAAKIAFDVFVEIWRIAQDKKSLFEVILGILLIAAICHSWQAVLALFGCVLCGLAVEQWLNQRKAKNASALTHR